jgi:outer membrane protein assembly factor BamB
VTGASSSHDEVTLEARATAGPTSSSERKRRDAGLRAAGAGAAVLLFCGCGGGSAVPFYTANSLLAPRSAGSPTVSESTSYLYVVNVAFGFHAPTGEVDIFRRDDPTRGVVGRIRAGVYFPDGIFIDSHGTLYVTNGNMGGKNSVEAYKKGSHTPFRIYSGAYCAFDVIAANDGTVYIADACGGIRTRGRVLVYAPGKTTPSRSLYPGGHPYAITLDSQNNLYVGYNDISSGSFRGQVKRYLAGASHGVNLLPDNTVFFLTDIAIDNHGALLVANMEGGVIDVFTHKDQPPSRVIKTGQGHPFMFTFDQSENRLYVSYPCVGSGGGARPQTSSGCGALENTVVALDYTTGKRLWMLQERSGGVDWHPYGVAVWPKAPF